MVSKQKRSIHHMLATNRELREKMESDAQKGTTRPKDETLRMAWDNGYRAHAAELLSIYNEVEDAIDGHNS